MSKKTKSQKQQIVIIGGGFGGIRTALELSRNEELSVTLISDKVDFQYYPTLYHTATGGLFRQSSIPINTLLEGGAIKFISSAAVSLQRPKKTVTLKNGDAVSYDTLVFALGSVVNYFGINGMAENSYSIKSIDEVKRFKQHLHRQLEDEKKPDLNYIIVGAGPTGIELAGALPSYIKRVMKDHGIRHRKVNVRIIEAAPRLLPRAAPSISKAVAKRLKSLGVHILLGKSVDAADDDSLLVGGKDIPSKTIVWTAGAANHPFFKENDFVLGERGKVLVDDHLKAEESIYVIGDNAQTQYSGMAQTALYDAGYVAHDIEANFYGNAGSPYKPHAPASVIPVGHHWASFEWKFVRLTGWLGWVLREAGDWVGFHDLEPWWKANEQWLTEFGNEEDCDVCHKKVL